jgi:bacterial/archaeal transporter family protein
VTAKWLVPTLAYIVTLGSLGVTSRLALKTYSWQDMLLWTTVVYVIVAAVLLATGRAHFALHGRVPMLILSAVIVVTSLILLYTALGHGNAATVVSITASYPAVTVLLAAIFLGEAVTVGRCIGVALVIGGVIVLTQAH